MNLYTTFMPRIIYEVCTYVYFSLLERGNQFVIDIIISKHLFRSRAYHNTSSNRPSVKRNTMGCTSQACFKSMEKQNTHMCNKKEITQYYRNLLYNRGNLHLYIKA